MRTHIGVVFAASLVTGFLLLVLFIRVVPPYGLTGAAVGIGLTYVGMNVLWALEARALVGGWHYDRVIFRTLAVGLAAGLAAFAVWFGVDAAWGDTAGGDLAARLAGLAGFAAVFVPGALRLRLGQPDVAGPADSPPVAVIRR